MKDVTYIGLWASTTSIFAYLTRTWPFLSYLTNLVLVHSIWSSSSFLKDKNFWKYPIMQVTSIMSQKRITMNMLEWKSCKCSTVHKISLFLQYSIQIMPHFSFFVFKKWCTIHSTGQICRLHISWKDKIKNTSHKKNYLFVDKMRKNIHIKMSRICYIQIGAKI